jgi:hypothetical protein
MSMQGLWDKQDKGNIPEGKHDRRVDRDVRAVTLKVRLNRTRYRVISRSFAGDT